MSEQNMADITAAAIAELEGSSSSVETTTENAPVQETETVAEDTETMPEVEEKAEESTEETAPEATKETEREQIKKEVERELKKKYYSKLNQEQKKLAEAKAQIESLKASGYDEATIEAVRKIVRAETQQTEVDRTGQKEYENFIEKFSPNAKDLKEISELVQEFPGMSYEGARKWFLAENRPEELIPKRTKMAMPGSTPSSIVRGPDLNDKNELLRQATEEAEMFSGRRR